MLRKVFNYLCLFIFTLPVYAQNPDCVNGGFEQGTFGNWTTYHSTRNQDGIVINNLVAGVNTQKHNIVGPGFDPVVGGNLLQTVVDGNFAAKLGDAATATDGDAMKYTFLVTNANKHFSFKYAMVLNDGGHNPLKLNPFFSYRVFRGASLSWGDFVLGYITGKQVIADTKNPYFKTAPGGVVWRDWSVECIDLSAYVGQIVSIFISAADCSEGGHYGYVYLDGFCSNNDPVADFNVPANVCIDEPLIADGTNSINEDSHFWSIQESDAYWNSTGPEYMDWFVAQDAGPFDLKAYIESKGGALKCNTYYRVKLAVGNNCVPWTDVTKLIYVRCPINEIDDIYACCGDKKVKVGPFKIPSGTNSSVNYTWSVKPTLPYSISTSGNFIVMENAQNATVTVTATDQNGCSATQDIKIFAVNDFTLSITAQNEGCCSKRLTANVVMKNDCDASSLTQAEKDQILSKLKLKWSNGSTANSITVNGNAQQNITLTGDLNGCFQHSASYNYVPQGLFYPNGYDREFIASDAFYINGNNNLTNKLIIYEFGPNAPLYGEPGAYGITDFRLDIYDRWGIVIRSVHGDNDCNFYQGEIAWDGIMDNGAMVPEGVYTYVLYIKTCDSNDFVRVCNHINTPSESVNHGDCLKKCWSWKKFKFICCASFDGYCGYRITAVYY